jgi:NAD(P)-dependent dehydrogenase (short-subunit alcohol dehydrogenase family)
MTNSFQSLRIFEGAVAIITGGASGIGAALARELAKRGSEVVLVDLQRDLAEEVAEEIRKIGGKARAIELNVADFPAVEALVQETVRRTGRLDYMFNNAGIGILGLSSQYRIEDWNRILDTNLRGVIHGTHAAYQVMVKQKFGHIINTASMAGLTTFFGGGIGYGTTKHAVVGLSTILRAEASLSGVRVSVLCPGVVRTPILELGKYNINLVQILSSPQIKEQFERFKPMAPEKFVIKTLKAISKNKAIIIIPSWYKLFWLLERLSPLLGIWMTQRFFKELRRTFGITSEF